MSLVVLIGAVAVAPVTAQEPFADAEAQARRALAQFMTAWNAADIEALRRTLNYPHLTLVGDRMVVADGPAQFHTDFEHMRRREGWAKSSFDSITVHQSSADKVHCEATYSRYHGDGTRYRQGAVLYAVTRQDGHWGMQFRSPLQRRDPAAGGRGDVEAQTRQAVLDFFTDFNRADSGELVRHLHFPHAFLLAGGRVRVAPDASAPSARMDFRRLQQTEGWHMSSLDRLEPIVISENVAHYAILFSRYRANGLRYRTVPALWTLTRRGKSWGVRFRSILSPVFVADEP